jgi:hypothetical protein
MRHERFHSPVDQNILRSFFNTEAQRAQRDVFDFTNQPPPSVEIGLNALPTLVPLCVLCASVFPIRIGSA